MMNAYEKAKQLTAKWEQERKDSKRLATMKEAERRIQVREFDNMLCLSLDGVPVLPMSEFNKQTLADARLTFFNYFNQTVRAYGTKNYQTMRKGNVRCHLAGVRP